MTAGSPAPGRVNRTGPTRRRAALLIAALLLLGFTTACATTAPPSAPPTTAAPAATPAPSTTASATPTSSAAGQAGAASPTPAASAAPGATAAAATVVIKNYQFVPVNVSVAAGATVMVDNQDSSNHTVTAQDGSFDTGNIPGNTTGRFTAPSKPGSYPYKCAIHPFMTGTLTVT